MVGRRKNICFLAVNKLKEAKEKMTFYFKAPTSVNSLD